MTTISAVCRGDVPNDEPTPATIDDDDAHTIGADECVRSISSGVMCSMARAAETNPSLGHLRAAMAHSIAANTRGFMRLALVVLRDEPAEFDAPRLCFASASSLYPMHVR